MDPTFTWFSCICLYVRLIILQIDNHLRLGTTGLAKLSNKIEEQKWLILSTTCSKANNKICIGPEVSAKLVHVHVHMFHLLVIVWFITNGRKFDYISTDLNTPINKLDMLLEVPPRYSKKTSRNVLKGGSWYTSNINTAMQSALVYPLHLVENIGSGAEYAGHLMRHERYRYVSFKTFPQDSVMWPMRLAQAGFFYTGREENVKCFCCDVTNGTWATDETPEEVHKRLSPSCRFVLGERTNNEPIHFPEYYNGSCESTRNIPGIDGQNESIDISCQVTSTTIPNLKHSFGSTSQASRVPLTAATNAKHPSFVNMSARVGSFSEWTLQYIQPNELAMAGFFYTGVKDFVRCFHCGVGLKNWQRGDNPMKEHARWSAECQYLKHRQNQLQAQPTLPEPNLCGASPVDSDIAMAEENARLKTENMSLNEQLETERDRRLCKICLSNDANTVFLSCRHMASCSACAGRLTACPICRKLIKGTVRVYQS